MIELLKQRVITTFGIVSLIIGYNLMNLILEGTYLIAIGSVFFTFLGVLLFIYREERLNKLLKIGGKRNG
ncbi:hypothetical protein LCGC14_0938240 [marine sediment metagenome]|uniref:Uncharacterized protein n=1 Tax=marine sediment metagenome TaxID=412755 RepID=A0A0F9RS90_9ZZZZ